jgi:alkanesulfonate monooxygenase SsuD/methylene tetrahydromethanopterin reductase-like flavin-dependent oxidoreductase (luciferase family)
MIGANAPRMLSITLPHVDAWNTWFTAYGNTVEGFAQHNAEISAAAERAGRDPAEIERSACVLVEVDGGTGERPRDVPAVQAGDLADHLRALKEAGADEAILVLDPITESSIRSLVSDTLGGAPPGSGALGV